MKILAIRINNLASLEGKIEIDFTKEPLSKAGIFAITGPTGAGKSTILDAICLSLYAETPRYKNALGNNTGDVIDANENTIKQNDARGILRDGATEGYAETDFIGVNGQHYRAKWSVHRAKKTIDGKLQDDKIQLKNLTNDTIFPAKRKETLKEIEHVVGLSFTQFTRSVLLAQGDFTAFLKANKNDKAALLEKLTGTHIYSKISNYVFETHKTENSKLNELNKDQSKIKILTTEELNNKKNEQEILTTIITKLENSIKNIENEINWHKQTLNLQTEVENAIITLNQAKTIQENSTPRKKQLKLVEDFQDIKPTVHESKKIILKIDDQLNELNGLKTQLKILQEKEQKINNEVELADEYLTVKIKEYNETQPKLNEAKALEVQLQEKQKQFDKAENELKNINEKAQNQQKQLTKKEKELETIKKNINKLNLWKKENLKLQPIAEHYKTIISELNYATITLKSVTTLVSNIKILEQNIDTNKRNKKQLDEKYVSDKNNLQNITQTYNLLNVELSSVSINDLEQEKLTVDNSVENIIKAISHWERLYRTVQEYNTLLQSIKNRQDKLIDNATKLEEANKLLESAKIQREISFKMLEKARLVATENVANLRNQLSDNEPCPVCGSLEHPYVDNNLQAQSILKELESSYKQIDNEYEKYFAAQTQLNQENKQLSDIIESEKKESELKQESMQKLEKEWEKFEIYTLCNQQPTDEQQNWLSQQHKILKSKQNELLEKKQNYNLKKAESDKQKKILDELNQLLNETENEIKDLERDLKSLDEQLVNSRNEEQKNNDNLDIMRKKLSVYFSSDEWFNGWKHNASQFLQQITANVELWNEKTNLLNEYLQNQKVLEIEFDAEQKKQTHLMQDVTYKTQEFEQIKNLRDNIADKLKNIFAGKSISTVESELKEAENKARENLKSKNEEKNKINESLTRVVTQSTKFEQDISQQQEIISNLNREIHFWLENYNKTNNISLTDIELNSLVDYSQQWINNERNDLNNIDKSLNRAETILQERNAKLEDHKTKRLSNRDLVELEELQASESKDLKASRNKFTEIEFCLKEDINNHIVFEEILYKIKEQEIIVNKWASLNEIIGSKSGQKFQLIAQEYTLDILVYYSNEHLKTLNSRYELQCISNSLSLQVIDKDMGNNIRSIYSLSGGETFLVSLALALGLASLSSNQMSVESLFIDEGFGSLDSTTLNIALDALERLHNQGRKVGVISHVHEMTERIPVQIKLTKHNSGRSNLRIIGN